jgi:hypothetical protein
VKERLARWRAAQEKALGLTETSTLADLTPEEIITIKQRMRRRANSGS